MTKRYFSEREKGKLPCVISEENGFDTGVLGSDRIKNTANRWSTAYKKNGILGLKDSRSNTSGRPRKTELTLVY